MYEQQPQPRDESEIKTNLAKIFGFQLMQKIVLADGDLDSKAQLLPPLLDEWKAFLNKGAERSGGLPNLEQMARIAQTLSFEDIVKAAKSEVEDLQEKLTEPKISKEEYNRVMRTIDYWSSVDKLVRKVS